MEQIKLTLCPLSDKPLAVLKADPPTLFFTFFTNVSLPPLFLLIKPELNISFTALGGIVSAFAATTAIGQIPAGVLVDRYGGRFILISLFESGRGNEAGRLRHSDARVVLNIFT